MIDIKNKTNGKKESVVIEVIKKSSMIKKILKTSILITFVAAVFFACEKDNDKKEGNSTNGMTEAVFNPNITYGTMNDQDGNIYKTVTIGTQTWMAENLRTTKYNDGTQIPNVTDNDNWGSLSTGAYCVYNNLSNFETIATFGCLYNSFAVNTGKLAPKGWHVPTDTEWTILITCLGGDSIAGEKLKEMGFVHWRQFSNTNSTNESGFTSLPGGYRTDFGDFEGIDYVGYWWSIRESIDNINWARSLVCFNNNVLKYQAQVPGLSVRCLKD